VAHHDLDTLSKIYLTLVHRNYKAEACNKSEELAERIKRMKPAVVILCFGSYQVIKSKLKTPAIVLVEKHEIDSVETDPEIIALEKPLQMDVLMHNVQKLVV